METTDCNSRDCSFCSHLRRVDYLGSRKASADRLNKMIDQRFKQPLNIPISTSTEDYHYQEWIDNELSLKGEPA